MCLGKSAEGMLLQSDTDMDTESDSVHKQPLLQSTNTTIVIGQSLSTLVIISMALRWDKRRYFAPGGNLPGRRQYFGFRVLTRNHKHP